MYLLQTLLHGEIEKLELCVEDDFLHRVVVDKQKVCMINIYEKNTEEKLLKWIKFGN